MMTDGVTGNTSDFGSEESRFEPWSVNRKGNPAKAGFFILDKTEQVEKFIPSAVEGSPGRSTGKGTPRKRGFFVSRRSSVWHLVAPTGAGREVHPEALRGKPLVDPGWKLVQANGGALAFR